MALPLSNYQGSIQPGGEALGDTLQHSGADGDIGCPSTERPIDEPGGERVYDAGGGSFGEVSGKSESESKREESFDVEQPPSPTAAEDAWDRRGVLGGRRLSRRNLAEFEKAFVDPKWSSNHPGVESRSRTCDERLQRNDSRKKWKLKTWEESRKGMKNNLKSETDRSRRRREL